MLADLRLVDGAVTFKSGAELVVHAATAAGLILSGIAIEHPRR